MSEPSRRGIQPTPFRSDIQALRGIAVILVVLQHAAIGPFEHGYLGVDIFFVISGFLITGIIASQIDQHKFSFVDFYFHRAKRILPAAYVTIVLTSIGAIWFVNSIEMQSLNAQVWGALTFTANLVLWRQTGYFDVGAEYKPLLHMWSLAVEEQFYIIFPAVLYFAPRRFWRASVASIAVVGLALCFLIGRRDPSAAFYLLPTRAWELCMGGLAALAVDRRDVMRAIWKALFWPAIATLMAIPIWGTGFRHPGLDAILVCTATLIVIQARSEWAARAAPVLFLAMVGDISYSLYLVHWPVMVFIHSSVIGETPAALRAGGVVVSLALALALYLAVERPFRRRFQSFTPRFATGVVTASVLIGTMHQSVAAYTRPAMDFANYRRPNYGLNRVCDDADFKPREECQTSVDPTLMVWGDSYAMHLVPGLVREVEDGVIQATFSACAPFPGYAPINGVELWSRRCIRFNQLVFDYLKASSAIKTVVLAGSFALYTDGEKKVWRLDDKSKLEEVPTGVDMAAASLGSLVDALRNLGKTVIVVGPAPSAGSDNSVCAERLITRKLTFGPNTQCLIDKAAFVRGNHAIDEFLDRLGSEHHARIVRLSDALCDDTTCRTIIDGKPIYRDSWHLSYVGSEKVFELLHTKNILW